MIRWVYKKYREWLEANLPDTTSTSPKTGREIEDHRVRKGPKFCVAFVRWMGKKF